MTEGSPSGSPCGVKLPTDRVADCLKKLQSAGIHSPALLFRCVNMCAVCSADSKGNASNFLT